MFERRTELATTEEHAVALNCLEAGIEAAHPRCVVDSTCTFEGNTFTVDGVAYDLDTYDRVIVVGGGNAAGHVAAALEGVLGDQIDDGVVVTDDPTATDRVSVLSGSHPVPDAETVENARRVLAAADADARTLVLAVITGGGSSLMTVPAGDVLLEDVRQVTDRLLSTGIPIDELNTVRKHLSAIKGGRLARAAAPADVVGLIFSDVVGNSPGVVASGPTVVDETTPADARAILDRTLESVPERVTAHLSSSRDTLIGLTESTRESTPTPGRVENHVLADGRTAIKAARKCASAEGYDPLLLSTSVRGEAREVGTAHLSIAEEVRRSGSPIEPPAVLLSGGETTVTVEGNGCGGPNQEFALASALELDDGATVIASVDTDGIDGVSDAAGAMVDATTVNGERARASLDANDAYPFLENKGALLRSGRTGTNVNDLRVVVVGLSQ